MLTAKKFTTFMIIAMLLLSTLPAVSFASDSEVIEEATTAVLISKDGEAIDLYESTESDSPVLTQLENGADVTLLEKFDEYLHVQTISADGSEIWEGYVKVEDLSSEEDTANTEAASDTETPVEDEQAEVIVDETEAAEQEQATLPNETEAAEQEQAILTDEPKAPISEPAPKLTGEALSGIAIQSPTKTYASPSTSSQVVKSYSAGTTLKFYDYSTSWYEAKVKVNDIWQIVYIQKSAVETITTNPVQVEAVAKLNPTVMYEKPSTTAKTVKSYKEGYILKLYTYTSSWYKATVKIDGDYQTAYLPKTSVELPNPASKAEQGIALKSPTNVYAYAGTSAKALKTYSAGSILKVYSYTNSWYRVTIYIDGEKQTGYILKSHIEQVSEENTEQTGLAQTSPTKVYKAPTTTASSWRTYAKNTILKYRVFSENWYIVKVKADGSYQTGYIKRSDISKKITTGYGLTLDQAVNYQMKMRPMTDSPLYSSFLQGGNPKAWVSATAEQVKKYLDPSSFSPGSTEYYQFLILSAPAGTNATELNANILSGKGALTGKASSFIQAASTYNINEVYLISHALLETGNGTSTLAKGISYNGTTVYNMYGIGAYDSDPINGGAKYAYEQGWTTVEKAIIGGAAFVAKSYINAGQDTLYKMRWNPNHMALYGYASHQYATDIGWAVKQTARMSQIYSRLTQYTLLYDVPAYKES